MDRRALVAALLCSPSILSAEKTNPEIRLSESFKLTVRFGDSSLTLTANEIWASLHPPVSSPLV